MKKKILKMLPLSELDRECTLAWMQMVSEQPKEVQEKADRRFREGLAQGRKWREEAEKARKDEKDE